MKCIGLNIFKDLFQWLSVDKKQDIFTNKDHQYVPAALDFFFISSKAKSYDLATHVYLLV